MIQATQLQLRSGDAAWPSSDLPWRYWNATDTKGMDKEDLKAFHEHYDSVHTSEVLSGNPGFVSSHRYRLSAQDDDELPGPTWLAEYVVRDEASVRAYVERDKGPPEGRLRFAAAPDVWYNKRQRRWRLIWRPLSVAGLTVSAARVMSIFGFDLSPPPAAEASRLAKRIATRLGPGPARVRIDALAHDLTGLTPPAPRLLVAVDLPAGGAEPPSVNELAAAPIWARSYLAIRDTKRDL